MCFNATASFVASGSLALAGGVALSVAKKEDRLLAAIPLLFAFQQFLEGLQWLSAHPSVACNVYGYGFLSMAIFLWPIYIPLTALSLETREDRKRLQKRFLWCGIVFSLFLLYRSFTSPLVVEMHPYGIHYNDTGSLGVLFILIHLCIVCGSSIACSNSFFRRWGLALSVLALIAIAVSAWGFISVWCFFSALLSASICVYLLKKNTNLLKPKQMKRHSV